MKNTFLQNQKSLVTIEGRVLSVCTFHFKCSHLHISVKHVAKISRAAYYGGYNTRITDAVISSTGAIHLLRTVPEWLFLERSNNNNISSSSSSFYRRDGVNAAAAVLVQLIGKTFRLFCASEVRRSASIIQVYRGRIAWVIRIRDG